MLTKDTTVLHPDAIHTDTVLPDSPARPAHRRPSLAGRAALVAGGAAVSALLTLLPAAPDATAPSPAVPPAATTATVNTPVVRLAARPAALTLNLEAVTAAAAPAAVRTAAVQKALGKIGSRYRYGTSVSEGLRQVLLTSVVGETASGPIGPAAQQFSPAC